MTRVTNARGVFGAAIVLYFIIALEVLIMISPFAAFFYGVFNPFLLLLAHSPATRWLAFFFLPHMVLPPGIFLQTIRIAGSVLFVGGAILFLVCAASLPRAPDRAETHGRASYERPGRRRSGWP